MKVRKALKELPNVWFFKASERTLAGIPDFILCINGIFVGLELKRSSKVKASRLQAHTLSLINGAGGIGIVASPDNWNKVLEALKGMAQRGICDRNELAGT